MENERKETKCDRCRRNPEAADMPGCKSPRAVDSCRYFYDAGQAVVFREETVDVVPPSITVQWDGTEWTPIEDQPAPVKNESRPIWDMVIDDMAERKSIGFKRYGTHLQAYNGRNAFVDAYQEILDCAVYLKQHMVEKHQHPETPQEKVFAEAIRTMQHAVHQNAVEKGFHQDAHSDAHIIGMIHSELSEALEGCRKGNGPDEHCPEFSSAEVELADTVIRIMDFCGKRDWNLGGAILAKHKYNRSREYMHGGKLF